MHYSGGRRANLWLVSCTVDAWRRDPIPRALCGSRGLCGGGFSPPFRPFSRSVVANLRYRLYLSFAATRCRQGFGRRTRLVQAATESTHSILVRTLCRSEGRHCCGSARKISPMRTVVRFKSEAVRLCDLDLN